MSPPSWTCSTCAVTVRWAPGHDGGPPTRWVRRGHRWTCLGCQRAEVREQAPEGDQAGALAEHELRHDNHRTDSVIARAVGVSIMPVRAARSRLLATGEITPRRKRRPRTAKPKRSPAPRHRSRSEGRTAPRRKAPKPSRPTMAELHPAVLRELRRDPKRSNGEIAVAARVVAQTRASACSTVCKLRHRLEATGEIERYRTPPRGPRPT